MYDKMLEKEDAKELCQNHTQWSICVCLSSCPPCLDTCTLDDPYYANAREWVLGCKNKLWVHTTPWGTEEEASGVL